MGTVNADTVREELRALGVRRANRDIEDAAMTKEINALLSKVRRTDIPKTEVAELLGVHRTTLYRVYQV